MINLLMKTLVLFVFHQYNKRVENFIKCIFYDKNIDFIVISNGPKNVEVPSYVKVLFRENIGYDFGGWSDALLNNDLYLNYDNFIFVNSSVIGPFCKDKWTNYYIDGLKDNVKLFGSTINTCRDPLNKSHVQSYIFAMNKETCCFLINCGIFSKIYLKTFLEAVWNKEVLMSQKIIKNGWNIGSLLPYYKDVDFTFKNKQPSDYKIFLDDIMYIQYRGSLWNEQQLIFIKGNRINI